MGPGDCFLKLPGPQGARRWAIWGLERGERLYRGSRHHYQALTPLRGGGCGLAEALWQVYAVGAKTNRRRAS